jgi:hypothetical protein
MNERIRILNQHYKSHYAPYLSNPYTFIDLISE